MEADGSYSALTADLGTAKSNRGMEQTVMFTIPTVEPELGYMSVEGVYIDQGNSVNALVGGSMALTYTVYPAEATPGEASWTSSDEQDASVERQIKIHGSPWTTAV